MGLPLEVLVAIFKHLPYHDRIAASETCRLWYEASRDITFRKVEWISLINNCDQNQKVIADLLRDDRNYEYRNFKFTKVEIDNIPKPFWTRQGGHIENIQLIECELQEKTFLYIISSCPNLKSLKLINCRELFMSASLLDDKSSPSGLSLKNLSHLSLANNRYLSDALFYRITSTIEKLQALDLSDCPITFHGGLHKKFYPNGKESDDEFLPPSESILSFPHIKIFLKNKGNNIRTIRLHNTLIDGKALTAIAKLPNLNLVSLDLDGCDQLNSLGITELTQYQKNITKLSLSMCSRLNDTGLKSICEHLPNLRELSISECNMITNEGVAALAGLEQLTTIDLSDCQLISENGIKNGICKKKNLNMTKLSISSLHIDESTVIRIAECFPNMTYINLDFCHMGVTNKSIQAIFKSMKLLQLLNLSACHTVSDSGLTGMGIGKQETVGESSENSVKSPAKNLNRFDDNPHRISLRSKAEEEIVRDAQRKQDVKELCENYIVGENSQGHSLVGLTHLDTLDLGGCNKITDVSLMFAFQSKALEDLCLNDCQQITHVGLKSLASNCPCLLTLRLSNCFNICDMGVEVVIKNLKRLRNLYLNGCNQLTNKTILTILESSTNLKLLDIRSCRNISVELANSLYNLPSFNTLHVSTPGPYINENRVRIAL